MPSYWTPRHFSPHSIYPFLLQSFKTYRLSSWFTDEKWKAERFLLRASCQLSSKKNFNHSVLCKPLPFTLLNFTLYCMVASSSESLVKVAQMVICIHAGDSSLIPGCRRSSGEGHGNPHQYSCLENPGTEEPGGLQSMGHKKLDRTEWLTLSTDSDGLHHGAQSGELTKASHSPPSETYSLGGYIQTQKHVSLHAHSSVRWETIG